MFEILKDYSTDALITAIKANLFEYYEYLGRSPSADLHEDDFIKWVLTGIPYAFLNNVLCANLDSANVDAGIQQILSGFKSRNCTKLSWWMGPGTRPENLGEHLIAHGLRYDPGEPGMAVDLSELREVSPSPELTIKGVAEDATLKDFVHSASIGFGIGEPGESNSFDLFAGLGFDLPLRNYVGYFRGEPVATSEMFLGAGVAGIYWVSTVPEARRKGIGAAMTHFPLWEARQLGFRYGILHSSTQGLDVYRRLGFEQYCQMDHYVWDDK